MTTPELTKRTLLARSLAAAALGAGVLYALTIVDEWAGDWGALLWMCGTLFFPWLGGVAVGRRASIRVGKVVGGAMGALLVLAPLAAFGSTSELADADLAALGAVFAIIGAVNGAMAFPVGIRVRRERPADES